jgi:hypothetical protein
MHLVLSIGLYCSRFYLDSSDHPFARHTPSGIPVLVLTRWPSHGPIELVATGSSAAGNIGTRRVNSEGTGGNSVIGAGDVSC